MTDNWNAVRRSEPATELDLVPDEAIDFACWVNQDSRASVTIYYSMEKQYSVVYHDEEANASLHGKELDEDEAFERAENIRENPEDYV